MQQRTLTLIIPAYNMREYLDACLNSLQLDGQDIGDDIQVIIVNDGSCDETGTIARMWHIRYPTQVAIVNKQNGHYGSCINAGLRQAKGRYVRILDADDTVDPSGFRRFVDYLRASAADLVLSDYVLVDNAGREFGSRSCREYDCRSVLTLLSEANPVQLPAITYRTQIVRDCGFRQVEGVAYSDTEWCIYPMSLVRTIAYSGCSVYRYRIRREGQSIRNYYRQKRDLEVVLGSLLSHYSAYTDRAIVSDNREMIVHRVAEFARFVLEVIIANAKISDLSQEYDAVFDLISKSNEIMRRVKEFRILRRLDGIRLFELMRIHFAAVFPLVLLYRWRLKIGGGR